QRVDFRARFLAKGLRRPPLLFRDRRRIGETLGDPRPEARAALLDPGAVRTPSLKGLVIAKKRERLRRERFFERDLARRHLLGERLRRAREARGLRRRAIR